MLTMTTMRMGARIDVDRRRYALVVFDDPWRVVLLRVERFGVLDEIASYPCKQPVTVQPGGKA